MVGLYSVHAALPLGLAQHLHINEDAVNARVRRDFCDCRVVGDVHKLQHMFSSNCRASINIIFIA